MYDRCTEASIIVFRLQFTLIIMFNDIHKHFRFPSKQDSCHPFSPKLRTALCRWLYIAVFRAARSARIQRNEMHMVNEHTASRKRLLLKSNFPIRQIERNNAWTAPRWCCVLELYILVLYSGIVRMPEVREADCSGNDVRGYTVTLNGPVAHSAKLL